MDDLRATLLSLSRERGESLSALSRMLRRNVAYLHQFVHRGTPRRLEEDDVALLAAHFGVEAAALGGTATLRDTATIPYLPVRAAAGAGRAVVEETAVRSEPFALALLREVGVAPGRASLVTAAGDSMAPAILDGDRLLVDHADTRADGRILVFRRDDDVAVKRLTVRGAVVTAASDNPSYPPREMPAAEVTVIGRVALLLRRPG